MRQRAGAVAVVERQAEVDLVDDREAAGRRTAPTMRPISSGSIEVPVGFDGEASSTPRVRSVHACLDARGVELPARFGWRRQQHRHALGRGDEVAVAGVARVRQQHLVVAVDQREAGELQRRRGAGRDDDAARGDLEAEATAIPAGDGLAQRRLAGRVGVLRAAGAQRLLGGAPDRGRRGEVGLADVQEDHRLAAARRVAFGRCAPARRPPWRTP